VQFQLDRNNSTYHLGSGENGVRQEYSTLGHHSRLSQGSLGSLPAKIEEGPGCTLQHQHSDGTSTDNVSYTAVSSGVTLLEQQLVWQHSNGGGCLGDTMGGYLALDKKRCSSAKLLCNPSAAGPELNCVDDAEEQQPSKRKMVLSIPVIRDDKDLANAGLRANLRSSMASYLNPGEASSATHLIGPVLAERHQQEQQQQEQRKQQQKQQQKLQQQQLREEAHNFMTTDSALQRRLSLASAMPSMASEGKRIGTHIAQSRDSAQSDVLSEVTRMLSNGRWCKSSRTFPLQPDPSNEEKNRIDLSEVQSANSCSHPHPTHPARPSGCHCWQRCIQRCHI